MSESNLDNNSNNNINKEKKKLSRLTKILIVAGCGVIVVTGVVIGGIALGIHYAMQKNHPNATASLNPTKTYTTNLPTSSLKSNATAEPTAEITAEPTAEPTPVVFTKDEQKILNGKFNPEDEQDRKVIIKYFQNFKSVRKLHISNGQFDKFIQLANGVDMDSADIDKEFTEIAQKLASLDSKPVLDDKDFLLKNEEDSTTPELAKIFNDEDCRAYIRNFDELRKCFLINSYYAYTKNNEKTIDFNSLIGMYNGFNMCIEQDAPVNGMYKFTSLSHSGAQCLALLLFKDNFSLMQEVTQKTNIYDQYLKDNINSNVTEARNVLQFGIEKVDGMYGMCENDVARDCFVKNLS
jgi:hypothetical protein